MLLKLIAGIIGAVLLLAYVAPVTLRLKEISLWVVVVLGVGMMLVDLWESLRAQDDQPD